MSGRKASYGRLRGRGPLLALLAANAISDTGTYITMLAVPWFVLQTTDSAARTGLAMFVATLPLLISGALDPASGTAQHRTDQRV